MSKRNLPAVDLTARPAMRSELSPRALDRWNPDVRAATDDRDDDATISVLDTIGADWFGEGVTAKRIAAALRAIGNRDVVVNINSPGGNFFEGLAIYNMLREHPAKVTVKVLGIAASAASVIAMAGDEIEIARAGFFMIHNTWVCGCGDRNSFREIADWLEPFDAAATDIYATRTGIGETEIAKMLDRETWIVGKDAVAKGFADALLSSDAIETSPSNSIDGRPTVAAHKVETLLAKAGVSRSERRELLAAMKGGMPGAAATGTRDAAVIGEVESLLASLKTI